MIHSLNNLQVKHESESEVPQSCLTLCDPVEGSLPGSTIHGIFPGKNAGVACHFFLQGIFPTWGSNPGLLHCRQTLYGLSHQGSPMVGNRVKISLRICNLLQSHMNRKN